MRSPLPLVPLLLLCGCLGRGRPGESDSGSGPEETAGRESGESGDSDSPDTGAEPAWIAFAPGSFSMGSPADEVGRLDDEAQHTVTLTRGFWLGRTEVTQAEFEALLGYNPSTSGACPACPVETVTWHEAAAYANALSAAAGVPGCYACSGEGPDVTCTSPADIYACLGARLPTEAEWEYAARSSGAVTDAYPNGGNLLGTGINPCGAHRMLDDGGNLRDVAWYCSNGHHVTHEVGTLAPSPAGLSDIAGNAWEWTEDAYAPYAGDAVDPVGYGDGGRVKRGGSWVTPPERVRIAYREEVNPAARLDSIGFRVCLPGGPMQRN